MVVYHGTHSKFENFDPRYSFHLGFHFGTLDQAKRRLKTSAKERPLLPRRGDRIIAAYLSIQNPLESQDAGDWVNSYRVWKTLDKATDGAFGEYDFALNEQPVPKRHRLIVSLLKQMGYDGIVYRNQIEGTGESWIAFDPSQIKSIDNDGTWDADDPRVGSNPFSVPSRNPPEIDGVEYGYAGIREGFKITGPYGETAIGYAYSADFPNDIGSPSRGELFLVNVPEEARGRGAGKAISIEALKLMTSHGAETVVMHATSVGGQRIIDSLIMDGYISEPIRASSTGKKEYRIHNDGVWDADEHGLHTGARP